MYLLDLKKVDFYIIISSYFLALIHTVSSLTSSKPLWLSVCPALHQVQQLCCTPLWSSHKCYLSLSSRLVVVVCCLCGCCFCQQGEMGCCWPCWLWHIARWLISWNVSHRLWPANIFFWKRLFWNEREKWEQKKGDMKEQKAVICFPFFWWAYCTCLTCRNECALNPFYSTKALLNVSYRHEIFKTFSSDKRLPL